MFETAFAQLRYAAAVLFTIPFDLRLLEKLVEGSLAMQKEFGTFDSYSAEFLGGPELYEETRHDVQLRHFQT